MRLSKRSPDFIWVARSDGRLFHVNWTKPSEPKESFRTNSNTARAISVLPIGDSKKAQEAVLVVETDKQFRVEITAYISEQGKKPKSKNLFSIKKNGYGLQLLESTDDGRILAGALNDRIFVATAATSPDDIQNLDQLRYDYFSFDTPDIITCLDLKVQSGKKGKAETTQVVDVLIGGARGGIYLYHDAVSRLQSLGKSKSDREALQAHKYHWHRRAVHSVKWSRDGMCDGLSQIRRLDCY